MPTWTSKALVVVGQVLLIWAALMLMFVLMAFFVKDPHNRPREENLRQLILPGLAFAVLIRIFKYKRLMWLFGKEEKPAGPAGIEEVPVALLDHVAPQDLH